jgi:predicted TPR repeat methyltransferase
VLADPTFATAHGEIGRIRAVKGDKAAAEEAWKAVLRIDPDNASARENLRRLGIEGRATESTAPE